MFTTTKYLVNDDFADMLGLQEPVTRKEVQVAFINYAINQDFIDLKIHHYLIYRHPKLKAMLGVDSLHPKNLFKYLRKMLVPIQRNLSDYDVGRIRAKSQLRRAEKRRVQLLYLTSPEEVLRLGYTKDGDLQTKQLALEYGSGSLKKGAKHGLKIEG